LIALIAIGFITNWLIGRSVLSIFLGAVQGVIMQAVYGFWIGVLGLG